MVDLDVEAGPEVDAAPEVLETVPRGTRLLYGGNRLTTVPDDVADAFRPGGALVVVQATGDVLHIPGEVAGAVDGAVRRAREAFAALTVLDDARIERFYEAFAAALADDAVWGRIGAANA